MKLPPFLTEHPYGEIRITGHRIGLYTIVRDYLEGSSAEEMAENYPTLSLDLIRQVIDFYLANRPEVQGYVTACRAEIERQEAVPPGPGLIKVREHLASLARLDKGVPHWTRDCACRYSGS